MSREEGLLGSKGDAVVEAVASYQYGPGSNPGVETTHILIDTNTYLPCNHKIQLSKIYSLARK